MNFDDARAEYTRLRQAYDQRQISAEEYGRRVQGLQVRDSNGTYWAIDGNSGGWLRYDGTAWVPGQPPVSGAPGGGFGSPPVASNFGQPAQNSFGQPAQSSFGQPQQGSYTPQPQGNYGAAPTPAPKKSRKGLFIGCGLAALLLLIACGVIGLLASQRLGTSEVVDATTASSITSSNRPDQKTDTFVINQPMYITYTAKNVKQGQTLELRLYRNGIREAVSGTNRTFDKDATFYGSFNYTPSAAGTYKAEFYYNNEGSPSQTVEFTVK